MFRFIGLATCICLLGCAPENDPRTADEAELIRRSLPGISDECVETILKNGMEQLPQDVRDCFPMEEKKRWQGLWLDEFEGSRFCAAPAEECRFETSGERVWLVFADEIRAVSRRDKHSTDALYKIEFVGRQTLTTGAFGHLGGSDREIVVEKLIRLERVP